MKKILIMAAAAVITVSAIASAAENDITVTVNGNSVGFEQPPVIDNDRTLVPMRAIFEALGAEVEWDGETRTVTSTRGEIKISLEIDSNIMTVGEREVTLDVPAKIINDRTMVPVRAVSEAMECDVDWNEEERRVIIMSTEESTAPEETLNPNSTAEPAATEVPAATAAPEAEKFAESVKTDIADDVNIFDTEWIIAKTEITPTDGKEKANEKLCATDFISVNSGKSYYASYYDVNNFKFAGGYCVNYAFYDADKKYISGAAADMAKPVKAPEYASYIRYTIKLESTAERAMMYLTFMQTEKAPEKFVKSEKITALAETEQFRDKKIFIVGDNQVQNSGVWTSILDKKLGAGEVGVKGFGNIRFTVNDYCSLCIDKTTNTFAADADYMIVSVGFYDWMNNYGIGTDISSNGGIYDFLDSAKSKWPNTQIVMMTLPSAKYAADGFTSAGIYNTLGMSTSDYSEQIVEACESRGIPVIDISKLWNENDMGIYMKQSNLSYLYPNEEGGKLIADKIYEKLIELENK
ncbi:MAG: stalk domain-containing protein [bacterium]|nr:stalk domain-containing protein [bacterium]